jgi:aspartyl-tRNA(Asn)/glutamyl-tRNA(Gln) amidotransferase subunit A
LCFEANVETYEWTIAEASQGLKAGKFSSQELTRAILARQQATEPKVRAFVTETAELAMAQAAEADARIKQGRDVTPLTGIPLALKDNLSTTGIRTTCSSRMLENYVPVWDATVVAKLKAAGAVFVGKTNLDEFAMGSSTENSAFGATRNPWNLECIPGGSSGGSAAAVSAGSAMGALGSDTGGSIRQPAACCGVVGLKPTYGRVSRLGLIAFASSLDQIGPFARTVRDCALISQAIDGHDAGDATSAEAAVPDYSQALEGGLKGLRIGLPKEYFIKGIDPEVESLVQAAIRQMEGLGAIIVPVSLPHSEHCLSVYYLLATAEASSNLARFDGVQYGLRVPAEGYVPMIMKTRGQGFGPEVKRRIMLGTYALSAGYYDAYYLRALKVRTLIKRDFDQSWGQVDVIATPTAPTAAFKAGEKTSDPLTMYLSDIFTISANLAGLPGLSMPCGFTSAGLPVGLQLIAKPFAETTLFRAAHAYEQINAWHTRKPLLT